jgi:hypothetical protein
MAAATLPASTIPAVGDRSMPRYRERRSIDRYDTGFPIAVIGIAMSALILFLAVGHLHEESSTQQARVFVPVAIQEARAK